MTAIVFAYDSGDFSFATCQEILDEASGDILKGQGTRKRVLHGAKCQMAFGFYVHGGMTGVTKAVVNHSTLARYLNAFTRAHVGKDATWGAISIFKGGSVKVHHDYNNAAGTKNYFASFGQESGGQLWTHDHEIKERGLENDDKGKIVWKRTGSGEWLPGTLKDTKEEFVEFDPRVKHHVAETVGEAWQIVAYTPRGLDNVQSDTAKFLRNCGFPLPSRRRRTEDLGGKRPNKKQRNLIANTVGKLSVLFATLLAAATSFLCETACAEVVNDPIVLLETRSRAPPREGHARPHDISIYTSRRPWTTSTTTSRSSSESSWGEEVPWCCKEVSPAQWSTTSTSTRGTAATAKERCGQFWPDLASRSWSCPRASAHTASLLSVGATKKRERSRLG